MDAPHRCPNCGNPSSDAEFCSECGASMAGAALAPAPAPPLALPHGPDLCPVCGEPRPGPFARYCDTCRYDFQAKRPFDPAMATLPDLAPIPPPPEPAPPPRHDLDATVDISLRREQDPLPTDLRPRMFPLDMTDHLIGRRSDSADIHPEIMVPDPGISRRHARILRAADGTLAVVDLGSMNGTRLNGTLVEPNVPVPLAAGDQLTLGCWTRLTVRPR